MIAAPFAFLAPASIDEAVEMLATHPGTAVIGGGTALVPNMSREAVKPPAVMDIGRLSLGTIRQEGASIIIGAKATYDTAYGSVLVERHLPVLKAMAAGITGGRSITDQGTLAGSACYANPSSDAPGCLANLDASFVLASKAGRRTVLARAFFRGAFETDRQADELLTEIRIPVGLPIVAAGYEKAKIAGSSWPIVTASCIIRADEAGKRFICVTIGAAGTAPATLEDTLDEISASRARSLADRAAGFIAEGWSDVLGEAAYRKAIAPEVARRAVMQAFGGLDGR